jgi:predicted nucleotidyltransferase
MRAHIRRFVLATSVPPFVNAYRAAYSVVAQRAVALFRRYPAVRSIYLCRGAARGAILPLISDLDFTLVVDGLSDHDREELLAAYAALARRTTILDGVLEIHDAASLCARYEANDYYRYRFVEGRASWRLLWGRDALADLPPASPESMVGPYLAELRVWWGLFAHRLLQGRSYEREVVPRNAICYKAAAETLRMIIALETGRLPENRAAAVSEALGQGEDGANAPLDDADRDTLARLERIARRRFRDRDDVIVEDTLRLLVRSIDAFFGRFATSSAYLRGAAVAVLSMTGDWRPDAGAANLARRVASAAPAFASARVVPAIYFHVDIALAAASIDSTAPPRVAELRAANAVLAADSGDRPALYLVASNAAFRIDGDDSTMAWQTILCAPMNPEVYRALGRTSPAWTPAVAHFVGEELDMLAAARRDPSIYKIGERDFQRLFWKTAQLEILERSARRGEAHYALTREAIAGALADAGEPLPQELAPFASGDTLADAAAHADLRLLRRAAIAYLESLAASPSARWRASPSPSSA